MESGRLRYRRVLLVGFMASGKSTVGSTLASRLGWEFKDFDAEVERRAGASVEEIFRRRGEAYFRDLEAGVGRELLRAGEVVLASGGGWPAGPGHMDELGEDTLSVWLRVSPAAAVRRAGLGGAPRPLLDVPDPLARAEALLAARAPHYRRAELHLDSEEATAEELAGIIAQHLEGSVRDHPGR